MSKLKQKAIVISASSDIGTALCRRWLAKGWDVYGTFRTKSKNTEALENLGAKLIYCDLSKNNSIDNACDVFKKICRKWDIVIFCSGLQNPISPFIKCSFNEWERSIKVNFINQISILHKLLLFRNTNNKFGPCVIFFAGGGINGATVNYSAYTIAKIALVKMCELLDAEILDTRFVIIGPGWVKTKIHEATLKAGSKAGKSFYLTLKKLGGNECTPMERILECCDWLISKSRRIVGGRNLSVVFDKWGSKELEKSLAENSNMYKLRRFGNDV